MRILITVASLAREFGGPVSNARHLAVGLRGLGHEVSVAGVGPSDDEVGLPALWRFHRTPIPATLSGLTSLVDAADVVHILGCRDPVGTAAAWTARKRRIPYVVEPSGMHRRRVRSQKLKWMFDKTIGDSIVRGASCLIATSKLEAQELVEDGVRSEAIRLRPNGIDLSAVLSLPPQGSVRRRFGIPENAPLILSLGRISAKKGLLHLPEALARLPDAWGLIVGPDDRDGTVPALMKARDHFGLQSRLVIHDQGLWGTTRGSAFADADVFCLPSANENFGNAVVEAAAAGIPVVLSDQCGAVEWLDPTATSVIQIGTDASSELAHAIAWALTDRARDAARRGASRLRASLSWTAIASQQAALYAELRPLR